jgi:hypothetical protein
MVARPARFKEIDVKRAVAGARSAGLDVERVEIIDNRIIIHAAGGSADRPADEAATAFDEWTARHAR